MTLDLLKQALAALQTGLGYMDDARHLITMYPLRTGQIERCDVDIANTQLAIANVKAAIAEQEYSNGQC